MRDDDPGRLPGGEGPDVVGSEAVPVVRARARAALARLVPVIAAATDATVDLGEALDRAVARSDDLYWAYYVTRPFTWQRHVNWWVTRRWVQPHDVRKS
jgi:hypothetical protein